MYFGCPLLRALNNDGENVLFPRKATGTNYPCICELSCGIAAPGRPRFAVSRRLFAACPRAKPSELHCSLGFGAHRSLLWAGKFCSLMKNVGSSIAPQAKQSIVPHGMSTGRDSLHHCSLAGQDLSCPHALLLGRDRLPGVPVPSPTPPQTSRRSSTLLECWEGAKGWLQHRQGITYLLFLTKKVLPVCHAPGLGKEPVSSADFSA